MMLPSLHHGALGIYATLPGPTMVHAEESSVPHPGPTTNKTSADNQYSLQRRQDIMDNRLNELHVQLNGLDTRTDTRQNEVNTRFNKIDSRLDGIETAISDMKVYLQERMQAVDKKVEWALTDIKPRQDGNVKEKAKVYGGCQDALAHGRTCSGVCTIALDCDNPIDVYCEQRLDGGGWTVFQVRYNGSVGFHNTWNTYKRGFGDLRGEFWLGNDYIHELTKYHDQQLKIELVSPDGEVKYADYSHFSVADESRKYILEVTGYSGGSSPGDSMAIHNGRNFSTKDQDNDLWYGSCAVSDKGGWWYNQCHLANLNGQYGHTWSGKGLNWHSWRGWTVSMKATRMMMKKRP